MSTEVVASARELADEMARTIGPVLADRLVVEATRIERAYALGRWDSPNADPNAFFEVVAQVLCSMDAGEDRSNTSVRECLRQLRSPSAEHRFPDPALGHRMAAMLRAVYRFDSAGASSRRGPARTSDEVESRFLQGTVRWMLAELLRLLAARRSSSVERLIDGLSHFPHPLLRRFGSTPFLQLTSVSVEDEILLHLVWREETGCTIADLVGAVPRDAFTVRKAAGRLVSSRLRFAALQDGRYFVTDLGRDHLRAVAPEIEWPLDRVRG